MRVISILGVLLIAMAAGGGTLFPTDVTAAAQQQSASLSGEVGAGERHVTRLRNLPQGADLDVEVRTDGTLRVLILDDDQFASLPGPVQPIFTGSGDARIKFQLVIPATGTYYLVVDNSEAGETRRFSLEVTASLGETPSGAASETRALAELERFESNLRQTFIFDELAFRIASCGQEGVSSGERTVTLCREIGPVALERLGDAAKARDVVLFMTLREVGRALLQQWEFPAADSADVVDQFAVVLHRMYDQAARLDNVVEFLDSFDPGAPHDTDVIDIRPQRVENLKRLVEDPDVVRQWQSFLVRHIQTGTLRVLANQPREWTDLEAVRQELAQR